MHAVIFGICVCTGNLLNFIAEYGPSAPTFRHVLRIKLTGEMAVLFRGGDLAKVGDYVLKCVVDFVILWWFCKQPAEMQCCPEIYQDA